MKSSRSGIIGTFVASILALSFVSGVPGSGRTAGGEEAARALVAESVEKLGGMEKLTSWETRVNTGHLVANWPGWGELHAECTQWVKKPDKMKIDQDFSAYDHPFFFTYYYNEGEVWVMVNLGVRQHPRYTDQVTRTMQTIDGLPHYYAEYDSFYVVTDAPGDSLLAEGAFDRVGMIGEEDTVFFDIDKDTRLPLRRIEEGGSRQLLFDDYREVTGLSGVKLPFHVTMYQNGALTSEYKWEDIKFNEKIEDAIFEEFRPEENEDAD